MDTTAADKFKSAMLGSLSRIKLLIDMHKFFASSKMMVGRHENLSSRLPKNTWLAEKNWAVLMYNPKLYGEDLTLSETRQKILNEAKEMRQKAADDVQFSTNFNPGWKPSQTSVNEREERKKAVALYKLDKEKATTKDDKKLCDIPIAVHSLEEIAIKATNGVILGWQKLQKLDSELKDVASDFHLVVKDAKRKFIKLAEQEPLLAQESSPVLMNYLGDYVAAQNVIRHHRYIRLIGTNNSHAMLLNLILESAEIRSSRVSLKVLDPTLFLRKRCTLFDGLIRKNGADIDVEISLRRLYAAMLNNMDTILYRNVFMSDVTFLMEELVDLDGGEKATDIEKAYFKMVFGIE